jgi:hypothetical protein
MAKMLLDPMTRARIAGIMEYIQMAVESAYTDDAPNSGEVITIEVSSGAIVLKHEGFDLIDGTADEVLSQLEEI